MPSLYRGWCGTWLYERIVGSEIAHRHISDNGAREKLLFEEVKRAAVGLAS